MSKYTTSVSTHAVNGRQFLALYDSSATGPTLPLKAYAYLDDDSLFHKRFRTDTLIRRFEMLVILLRCERRRFS